MKIENHILDDAEEALELAQTTLSAIYALNKAKVIDLPKVSIQSIETTLEKVTKALYRAQGY